MQSARISTCILATAFIAIFACAAHGSDDVPVMITDRPDISVSSRTVPRAYFQLESNLAYNVDRILQNRIEVEINSLDLLNALMRFGLSDHLELRLSTLYTFKTTDSPDTTASIDGINGLVLGAKIHLFEERGVRPDAALLVEVGLPVGKEEFTENQTLPGVTLAASHIFDKRFGIAYNIGGQRTLESDFLFKWSVALPVTLSHKVAVFAEVFGNTADGIDPMVSVDGGGIWQIRRNIQFDATGGLAVTEAGNDWFGTAGFSFRLPR
jgi:hypothetical protein